MRMQRDVHASVKKGEGGEPGGKAKGGGERPPAGVHGSRPCEARHVAREMRERCPEKDRFKKPAFGRKSHSGPVRYEAAKRAQEVGGAVHALDCDERDSVALYLEQPHPPARVARPRPPPLPQRILIATRSKKTSTPMVLVLHGLLSSALVFLGMCRAPPEALAPLAPGWMIRDSIPADPMVSCYLNSNGSWTCAEDDKRLFDPEDSW